MSPSCKLRIDRAKKIFKNEDSSNSGYVPESKIKGLLEEAFIKIGIDLEITNEQIQELLKEKDHEL